jgi:hypothetical protein
MPQGGADNIISLVSDNGKNLVRFDADKGTLDLIIDQNGILKFKNLDIEVEEHTHIKTKTLHMEIEESAKVDIGSNVNTNVGGNATTEVAGNITEIAGGEHVNKGTTIQHN